jgi:hypothetical protein
MLDIEEQTSGSLKKRDCAPEDGNNVRVRQVEDGTAQTLGEVGGA